MLDIENYGIQWRLHDTTTSPDLVTMPIQYTRAFQGVLTWNNPLNPELTIHRIQSQYNYIYAIYTNPNGNIYIGKNITPFGLRYIIVGI